MKRRLSNGMEERMKLQQMNNKQYFITLPNMIVRAKGWVKGDEIKVEINKEGNLLLKKK
jgi:phosphate uptake regulator|tara:strand:- start:847 stop:1023 length:177 start_codon:yes stop_codon:yes gene_type:complete